jgi:hypothetical protein
MFCIIWAEIGLDLLIIGSTFIEKEHRENTKIIFFKTER